MAELQEMLHPGDWMYWSCEDFAAVTAVLIVRCHADQNQTDQYARGALLCALWLGRVKDVHPIRRRVEPCTSNADVDSALLAAIAVADDSPWAQRGVDRRWALGVYKMCIWAGGGLYPPTRVAGISPERPAVGVDWPQIDWPQNRRPADDLHHAYKAMWSRIRAEHATFYDLRPEAEGEEDAWCLGVLATYEWLIGKTDVGPLCDGPASLLGRVRRNLELAYDAIRKESPSPLLMRGLSARAAKAVGVAQLIEYAYELRPDPPLCWPRPAAHRTRRVQEAA